MSDFEQLVTYLFNSITKVSEHPQIEFTQSDEFGYHILVNSPESNIGQLIGKEGKIIKAIRTILSIAYPTVRYQIDFAPPAPTASTESL